MAFSSAVRIANSSDSRILISKNEARSPFRARPGTSVGKIKPSISVQTNEDLAMQAFQDLPVTPIRNTSVLRRQRRVQNDPWNDIAIAQSMEHERQEERKKIEDRRKAMEYAKDLQTQVESRMERSRIAKREENLLLEEMHKRMNAQDAHRERERIEKRRVRRQQLATWATEVEKTNERKRYDKLRDLREDYLATRRNNDAIELERRREQEKRGQQKVFFDRLALEDEEKKLQRKRERERRLQDERENPATLTLDQNKMSPQERFKLANEWAAASKAEKQQARKIALQEELKFQAAFEEEARRHAENLRRKEEKRKNLVSENRRYLDFQKELLQQNQRRQLVEKEQLAATIRQIDEADLEKERLKVVNHRQRCKAHQMHLVDQIEDHTQRKEWVSMSLQERQINRRYLDQIAHVTI